MVVGSQGCTRFYLSAVPVLEQLSYGKSKKPRGGYIVISKAIRMQLIL